MKEKTAPEAAIPESRFTGNFRLTLSEISVSMPQNGDASTASPFFGKLRSKVIVRVTRKCLPDIFSFPEHLAPAEGIDPKTRSRWSQFLRSICKPSLHLPMVAYVAACP